MSEGLRSKIMDEDEVGGGVEEPHARAQELQQKLEMAGQAVDDRSRS